MSAQNLYVSLSSLSMDPCDLTDDAYAEARSTWLCRGCCLPNLQMRAIDARLEAMPTDKPLNIVHGCGLPVVYKPFLDRFPSELVRRDLYLGRVWQRDGTESAEWVTFRGRRRVIIRGDKNAGHRTCEICGRDLYFAMGNAYLYPKPPRDAVLLESDLQGLVLPEDHFAQLDIGTWSMLQIQSLPVLDAPRDGFGELPHASREGTGNL
jgi:hypothetical protein